MKHERRIYEIGNPSDMYTMASENEAAAAVACMMLGSGAYCLKTEDGRFACPFFLFGGDPDEWLAEEHGTTIAEVMESQTEDVIKALWSVLIGGFRDREEVEEAIALMPSEEAVEWLDKRHDRRRSSMNNIGKRALEYAAHLRKPQLEAE